MSTSSNTVSSHWGDVFQAIETCYDLGWTDGLPVIPPTVERVSQFLDHIKADGSEILGEIPERRRQINVEKKLIRNAIENGDRNKFDDIRDIIESTGSIKYASALASNFAEAAKANLKLFPESPFVRALYRLADFSVFRIH